MTKGNKIEFVLAGTVPICAITSGTLFHFNHDYSAIFFVLLTILSALFWMFSRIKNYRLTLPGNNPKIINAFAVNHPDDIIIRAIADNSQSFKTIPDIARETDLPLKQINRLIDFLIMNNFATEEKIRHGKTYILTPQGREAFKQQLEK